MKFAERDQSRRRSDDIRRRRKQQSRPVKAKQKARRGTVPSVPGTPPVMARRVSGGTINGKQKSNQRTKRRYDVALNAHGAEMRIPALPRLRLGWRVASAFLVAMLAYVLYQFWNAPEYQVEAAQINGLQRVSKEDVNRVVDIDGLPIFLVDPQGLQDELVKEFTEFESVAVAVNMPQTVLITVTERIPVLIWRQGEHSELVDMNGMAFPARDSALDGDLIVVEASDAPPPLPTSDVLKASPTLSSLLEFEDDPLGSEVVNSDRYSDGAFPLLSVEMIEAIQLVAANAPQGSKLTYSSEHGLGWEAQRGWVVYFGNMQDMQMKIDLYHTIAKHLDQQDTLPTMISVEFPHAPYYRLQAENSQ